MSGRERITKELLVEPGTEANIAGRDPAWTGGPEFEQLSAQARAANAEARRKLAAEPEDEPGSP